MEAIERPLRPGTHPDPHPDWPPALHHGERHLTGSEPLSGGAAAPRSRFLRRAD